MEALYITANSSNTSNRFSGLNWTWDLPNVSGGANRLQTCCGNIAMLVSLTSQSLVLILRTTRFNPRKFYVLPHLYVFCADLTKKTAIISLYSVCCLVFITETECVYCAVRTEYLNKIWFLFVSTFWYEWQPPVFIDEHWLTVTTHTTVRVLLNSVLFTISNVFRPIKAIVRLYVKTCNGQAAQEGKTDDNATL